MAPLMREFVSCSHMVSTACYRALRGASKPWRNGAHLDGRVSECKPQHHAAALRACNPLGSVQAWKQRLETDGISCYDVSEKTAKIGAGARDSIDRARGLCYGKFRMSFVVFPGGEKRFRHWLFVFMQAN